MAIPGLANYSSSDDGSASDPDPDPELKSTLPSLIQTKLPPSASSPTLQSSLPPPRKKLKPSKARILLDLPPIVSGQNNNKSTDLQSEPTASKQDDVQPHSDLLSKLKRKKPDFNSAAPKKSGLASILPPPKRIQTTTTPGKSSTLPISSETRIDRSKLKDGIDLKPSGDPIIKSDSDQPSSSSSSSIPTKTITENLNLFGLPTTETNAKKIVEPAPTESIENSRSLAISSAPQVTEEQAPEPSLLDPYPGYWQSKDGRWIARDPEEPIWKAFYLKHYCHQDDRHHSQTSSLLGIESNEHNDHRKDLPKDFFKDSSLGNTSSFRNHSQNIIDFDAQQVARTAWENKPKIIDPREEARREQEASIGVKPAKHISARARGRHQLSSLLTEAQSNRAELEDRIARGKLNRKAGGAKYGF